eukprot:5908987-Amphidinium_carterae.1
MPSWGRSSTKLSFLARAVSSLTTLAQPIFDVKVLRQLSNLRLQFKCFSTHHATQATNRLTLAKDTVVLRNNCSLVSVNASLKNRFPFQSCLIVSAIASYVHHFGSYTVTHTHTHLACSKIWCMCEVDVPQHIAALGAAKQQLSNTSVCRCYKVSHDANEADDYPGFLTFLTIPFPPEARVAQHFERVEHVEAVLGLVIGFGSLPCELGHHILTG